MWPFSSRNRSGTSQEPDSQGLAPPEGHEYRLSLVEGTLANLVSSQADLERQHRSDHLELLDLHERVKKSLAKMNRRAQSDRDEQLADETDQPAGEAPDNLSQPRARLLSRRRG